MRPRRKLKTKHEDNIRAAASSSSASDDNDEEVDEMTSSEDDNLWGLGHKRNKNPSQREQFPSNSFSQVWTPEIIGRDWGWFSNKKKICDQFWC